MDKRILYLAVAALFLCAAMITAEGGQEKAARVTLTVAGRDGA
jgi:hypothetical protein